LNPVLSGEGVSDLNFTFKYISIDVLIRDEMARWDFRYYGRIDSLEDCLTELGYTDRSSRYADKRIVNSERHFKKYTGRSTVLHIIIARKSDRITLKLHKDVYRNGFWKKSYSGADIEEEMKTLQKKVRKDLPCSLR
jgi:hypothetical protein